MSLLDAELAFINYKYGPDYSKQPAHDMQIYKAIRARWIELKNEEMKRTMGKYAVKKQNSRRY